MIAAVSVVEGVSFRGEAERLGEPGGEGGVNIAIVEKIV